MPEHGWFSEFVMTHVGRFPRSDWNDIDPIFWRSLAALFTRRGVTEQEAHEASARLFGSAPAFVADHPARLIAAVEAIRRENGTAPVPTSPRLRADGGPNWTSDQADSKWDRTPEADREHWRQEVRRKLPELCARGEWWCEGLARGWNVDHALAASIGEPPKPRTPPRKQDTPRTAFRDWATVDSPSRPADAPCAKPEPSSFDDWDHDHADLGPEITETR